MELFNEDVLLIILIIAALALAAFLWYGRQDKSIEGSPADLSYKELLATRYPNVL